MTSEEDFRDPLRMARVRRLWTKDPSLSDANIPGVTTRRILLFWADEDPTFGTWLIEYIRRYPDGLSKLTPIDTIARDWRAVLKSEKDREGLAE